MLFFLNQPSGPSDDILNEHSKLLVKLIYINLGLAKMSLIEAPYEHGTEHTYIRGLPLASRGWM
jgi:hypothetical protein